MSEFPHRDPVVLIVAGLVLLVALPLLWGAAMMTAMGPWMMGGWGGSASPWWGLLGLAFGLLVIAGLSLIAVWALRRSQAGEADGDARALSILNERFARGELTHEQYEQMRRVLAGRE